MSASGASRDLAAGAGGPPWRLVLAWSAAATGLGLTVALAGALTGGPGAAPGANWHRFWATAFFIVLLWPCGLALTGRLAGLRAELGLAGLLLVATLGQHSGRGSIPLPEAARWWVTLAVPGDAIRHRLPLPGPQSAPWERAWREAARAAVYVCADPTTPPSATDTLTIAGHDPVPLASLPHHDAGQEASWFALTVTEAQVRRASSGGWMEVVVRRDAAGATPLRLCGGRDDPGRPGAASSERWRAGRWVGDHLGDEPFPLVGGRPILGRYFVELRFLDGRGRPTVDIWY